MKAAEYYSKHKKGILEGDDKTVGKIIAEMVDEANVLIQSRKAKSDDAIIGIIEEMNQKMNAVAHIAEKEAGRKIIPRNAFRDCIKEKTGIDTVELKKRARRKGMRFMEVCEHEQAAAKSV